MYRYSLRTVRVAFLILNPKYLYISDIDTDLMVLTLYIEYHDKRYEFVSLSQRYILNLMCFHYSVGRYIVL